MPAVVGEDKELRGGEGKDFVFRGCMGVVVLLAAFSPPYLFSSGTAGRKRGGDTSVKCGRDDIFP